MNREILFRAKSIQTDKWISGYYFEDEDNKSYIGYMSKKRYIPDTRDWDTVEYYENNPTYNWVFVKEEVVSKTVGEYTGLTDKNNVQIFEGDIVKITRRLRSGMFSEDSYICKYNDKLASFEFKYIIPKDLQELNRYAIMEESVSMEVLGNKCVLEVVGNVYDSNNAD